MGSDGVVSIRVEGFSITIADGRIAIEQTTNPAPKAEAGRNGLTGFPGDSGKGQEAPASSETIPAPMRQISAQATLPVAERTPAKEDLFPENPEAVVIDEVHTPDRASSNGGLQEALSGQTKPVWTADEAVEWMKDGNEGASVTCQKPSSPNETLSAEVLAPVGVRIGKSIEHIIDVLVEELLLLLRLALGLQSVVRRQL
jgi:hypothetical protein